MAALHSLVADLGLSGHVRFVPPQPHELLSTYYRAADCCPCPAALSPSDSSPSRPPPAGPGRGRGSRGLTTLVHHGRTGYLVEDGDAEAYARFAAAICNDPLLQAELGAGAAAMASGYSWSSTADRLVLLYDHLTSRTLVEC